MAHYSVYLSDPFIVLIPPPSFPPKPPLHLEIANKLRGLFNPIAQGAGFADGVAIQWLATTSFNPPDDVSMLVHVLPTELQMIKKLTHAPGPYDPLTTHMGRTWTEVVNGTAQTLSEVYYNGQGADAAAKVIFHECMHNKLRLIDAQLHPTGGLASATVDATTQLTPTNANMMIAQLRTPRKQWPDVVQKIAPFVARRVAGDPVWYEGPA